MAKHEHVDGPIDQRQEYRDETCTSPTNGVAKGKAVPGSRVCFGSMQCPLARAHEGRAAAHEDVDGRTGH